MDRIKLKSPNLCELALACSMYDALTPFNESLRLLRDSCTSDSVDLSYQADRLALLKWLNDWGCRHLSEKSHPFASSSIMDWHNQEEIKLFKPKTLLWDLDDRQMKTAASAYASLRDRTGAKTPRGDKELQISIGPTAASKILFALRPEALMPWDEAMRKQYDCDGSPESYFKYLVEIRKLTLHIKDLCEVNGFDITELPQKLSRKDSTVLELVNEYIYVTITRNRTMPSAKTLAIWAQWGLSREKIT